MNIVRKEFQFGEHKVVLETGRIARQASGAVMVSMGDTVVLVTCVVDKEADPGHDFFPLTVDYQERTYAAGKIPGGFFKREGRPSEKETLTSNLALPENAFSSELKKTKNLTICIEFYRGEATKMNGKTYSNPVELIEEINELGSDYAIGRDIHVGDTGIGIKGRVAFEAPAATILIKAHHLLEKHTLTKWQAYWKKQLSEWYGMMMHEGQFLDPVMRNIEKFLLDSQDKVSGEVYVKLKPYHFQLLGIKSDNDLMQARFGVYGEDNKNWTGEEAKAFIKLMSTPHKIYHDLHK